MRSEGEAELGFLGAPDDEALGIGEDLGVAIRRGEDAGDVLADSDLDAAWQNQRAALITPGRPDAGICNVPGVGDIGGLVGLCNAGSGVVGDFNNICASQSSAVSGQP